MLIGIPTYNEADNIEKLVAETKGLYPKAFILVVDSSDNDRTVKAALAGGATLVVSLKAGTEYRFKMQHILGEALHRHLFPVVIMHAGGAHTPHDIFAVLNGLTKVDVAIGSRFVEGGVGWQKSWWRRLLTFVARRSMGILVGDNHVDYSGLKGFTKVGAEQSLWLLDQVTGDQCFVCNPQWLYLICKAGLLLGFVPFHHTGSATSLGRLDVAKSIIHFVYFLVRELLWG